MFRVYRERGWGGGGGGVAGCEEYRNTVLRE